jgi:hypothetical protein
LQAVTSLQRPFYWAFLDENPLQKALQSRNRTVTDWASAKGGERSGGKKGGEFRLSGMEQKTLLTNEKTPAPRLSNATQHKTQKRSIDGLLILGKSAEASKFREAIQNSTGRLTSTG